MILKEKLAPLVHKYVGIRIRGEKQFAAGVLREVGDDYLMFDSRLQEGTSYLSKDSWRAQRFGDTNYEETLDGGIVIPLINVIGIWSAFVVE